MPPPIAAIVITASVLIAAGLAAYESPQVREWVDKSRRRIAIAIQTFGDELVNPHRLHGSKKDRHASDPSMDEEKSGEAEERRRQARAEILERGRILEERKRRRREAAARGDLGKQRDSGVDIGESFDSLVDEDGYLKNAEATAESSAFEHNSSEGLTKRTAPPSPPPYTPPRSIPLQDLPSPSTPTTTSNYESSLRQTFNLPLPQLNTTTRSQPPSSAASLVDLTPTTSASISEFEYPDPEISVPNLETSTPTSPPPQGTRSHTISPEPLASPLHQAFLHHHGHRRLDPFEASEDDEDLDDGMRTPEGSQFSVSGSQFSEVSAPSHGESEASGSSAGGGGWTDVSSQVSGDQ